MAKDIWCKLAPSKEKKVLLLLAYFSLMIPDIRKHTVNDNFSSYLMLPFYLQKTS